MFKSKRFLPLQTIWSVATPDAQTFASASQDKLSRFGLYQIGNIRTLTGHSQHVLSVAISPDGQTLASGGGYNTVKLPGGVHREVFKPTGHKNRYAPWQELLDS